VKKEELLERGRWREEESITPRFRLTQNKTLSDSLPLRLDRYIYSREQDNIFRETLCTALSDVTLFHQIGGGKKKKKERSRKERKEGGRKTEEMNCLFRMRCH
jgi:hypothetical protein